MVLKDALKCKRKPLYSSLSWIFSIFVRAISNGSLSGLVLQITVNTFSISLSVRSKP